MPLAELINVDGRELIAIEFQHEATEYTVNVDADGNVKARKLDGSYLLEHLRKCGLFKCTECLYCNFTDTQLGTMYECWHPGTLRCKGMNDEDTIMRGSACFWFEPRARAGERVALRYSQIHDTLVELWEFAWWHAPHSYDNHTSEEKQLSRIRAKFRKEGVVL